MDKVLRRKLYKLWHNIKNRCCNVNHPRYKQYGGRGVVMCDKWLTFDGFLEDVENIDGYCEYEILNGKLCLDKDSKDIDNKIYCLDKCSFIDITTNNKFKPSQMRKFIGISPSGEEFIGYNISEFARVYNLHQQTISDCLNDKIKKHKGWIFKLVK